VSMLSVYACDTQVFVTAGIKAAKTKRLDLDMYLPSCPVSVNAASEQLQVSRDALPLKHSLLDVSMACFNLNLYTPYYTVV